MPFPSRLRWENNERERWVLAAADVCSPLRPAYRVPVVTSGY